MLFADVPSGSDGETVREYYDYLYSHYISEMGQTFRFDAAGLLWWGFWVVILVAGIYLATRLQRSTRAPSEPYPVESYNGYITEANGPAGPFLLISIAGVVLWLIIITVYHLVQGQIY
jgi:hypothetical protein